MVSLTDLDKVGVIVFEFVNEPQLLEVHVFRAEHYTGVLRESEGAANQVLVHYTSEGHLYYKLLACGRGSCMHGTIRQHSFAHLMLTYMKLETLVPADIFYTYIFQTLNFGPLNLGHVEWLNSHVEDAWVNYF